MHIQSLMFFKFSNFVCFQIDVVHHFVFYVVNDRLLMALKIPSFLCYENRQFSLADALIYVPAMSCLQEHICLGSSANQVNGPALNGVGHYRNQLKCLCVSV